MENDWHCCMIFGKLNCMEKIGSKFFVDFRLHMPQSGCAHRPHSKTSVTVKPRRHRLVTLPAQTYRHCCKLLYLRGVSLSSSSSEPLSSSELVCGYAWTGVALGGGFAWTGVALEGGFAWTGVALGGTAFPVCGTLTVGVSSSEPKTNGIKINTKINAH